MLPAASFDDILDRAEAFGNGRLPMADRLVSVVFASPSSPVWADVQTSRAFLDARSGTKWDLFFAGLSSFAPTDDNAIEVEGTKPDYRGYFNPAHFNEIESIVSGGHASLRRLEEGTRSPWRYSGGTDLVSFMVYGRQPDWRSLKATVLYTRENAMTLGSVVEGLTNWETDDVNPAIAPGQVSAPSTSTEVLSRALAWSAGVGAAGVFGNTAYALAVSLVRAIARG